MNATKKSLYLLKIIVVKKIILQLVERTRLLNKSRCFFPPWCSEFCAAHKKVKTPIVNMRHLGNPPFISFWLKIYPVFVCASTFKVTPNRLYFSLAASDASRQQRINTMNEVGRGVMVLRGGGSTSGPRPGIHLPAISLRKLPFKALRGWSLEDMPIDKAGSSIAPVIQRPSPCASWSSDKDGWGCRAIPASQIAHRNDADGALVKEDRNSLCLTQVRFTYPVLHMDPLPGWK